MKYYSTDYTNLIFINIRCEIGLVSLGHKLIENTRHCYDKWI